MVANHQDDDMPLVVGVSLGSHYACIALPSMDGPDAPPAVIANPDGDRQIPVVFAYAPHVEDDGSIHIVPMIGSQAQAQKLRNLKYTVSEFMDVFGLNWDDETVKSYRENPNYHGPALVKSEKDGGLAFMLPDPSAVQSADDTELPLLPISVLDICTAYFKHLDDTVRHYIAPKSPEGYCISHPAHST